MKLHTFDRQRSVSKSHNDAVVRFGGDLQHVRQRLSFDDKRMISADRNLLRHAGENGSAVVAYPGRMPVNRPWCPDDPAAKELTDRLMSETYAEYRQAFRKFAQNVQRYPGIIRCSRPGRKHYPRRSDLVAYCRACDFVIADDLQRGTELADVLDEVVGKRIVVVDKQQHFGSINTFTIFRYFFIIVTSEITEEPMSKFPTAAAIIFFAALMCFSQQPATEVNTSEAAKTAEQEKAEKEFRENRTAFLNNTLIDLQNLRTRENRIFFSSEIASVMWKEDEKRARSLFANAAGELIEVIRSADQALTAAKMKDEGPGSYGLFGDPPDSFVLRRKLSTAIDVRRGLTSAIMELDPDLAFSFYLDSREVISDPEMKTTIRNQDGYFEARLLTALVRTNAQKAAELGKRSIKDGVDYGHIELLRSIYTKDPDKGVEFGSAVLSSIKDHGTPVFVLIELLNTASILNDGAKNTGKTPIYTESEMRDIAELAARYVLDNEQDEGTAVRVVSAIEKYLPSRVVQIRAKYKLASSAKETGRGEAYTVKTPSTVRNSVGVGAGVRGGGSMPAEVTEEQQQAQAMQSIMRLDAKKLSEEERQKIITDARRIISGSRDRSQKIIGLGMLATQVARLGDKDLAAQIMRDAETLVNPQPRNARDYLCSWMLVSGYAETDPEKAFRTLDDLLYRANDLINSAMKVAEFIDVNQGILSDGEVQLGDFGSSMIRGMTGELGMAIGPLRSLAKADFKRAAGLTDRLERPEVRILAKMLFLRAVYQDGGQTADIEEMEKALN